MKREILNLMCRTRAFEPIRLANGGKALVLHYHRFSSQAAPGATTARVFEEQLAYLTRRYEIVPLTAIVQCLARGVDLPRRTLAITVDDGYRDFYEVALPILQRFKAPATVFAVADFVDRKCWIWTDKMRYLLKAAVDLGRPTDLSSLIDLELLSTGRLEALYSDASSRPSRRLGLPAAADRDEDGIAGAADRINSALKSLSEGQRDYAIKVMASRLGASIPDQPPKEYESISWDELRHAAASGVEVGSHSMTHPILTRESNERVRYEISESKSRIEHMVGRAVRTFCYPNGDYERRSVLEARRARYAGAVTCRGGLNPATQSPYEVRRVHTVDDFALFLQGITGLEQVKHAIRRRRPTGSGVIDQWYGAAE